ncbi:MAG: hypothetical protein K2R98_26200 [Gemmataceae bacterium]|nr:hypothetical protein [Gemmataceae bacterium]
MSSPDPNPFGEIKPDIEDRMPQRMSATQTMQATVGLLVMALGGLLVAAGFLVRMSGSAFGFAIAIPGFGCCAGGYWIYANSQRRRRKDD